MLSRLILGKHATALGSLVRVAFDWAAPTNRLLHVSAATTAAAPDEDVLELEDPTVITTTRRVIGLTRNALRLVGHVTHLMPTDEPLRMFETEGILDEVFARLAALGRTEPAEAAVADEALPPMLSRWEAWLLACASDATSAATSKVRITLAHLGIYTLLEHMRMLDVIAQRYPATHKLMTHIRQELKLDALEYDKIRLRGLLAEAQALEARITRMSAAAAK